MKVAHINKTDPESDQDWLLYAKKMEKDGDLDQAEAAYKKIISNHATNSNAYNRLMIIYRRKKEYKKELKLVNAAIKIFEETFSKKLPFYNKRITAISKSLLKATGLADKKGNSIYQPGELARWKKRKSIIFKKIKNE